MWYCNGDQMIKEFVYMVVMQGDFGVYWYVFMNVEISDRFFCMCGDSFLIGNSGQIFDS